MDRKDFLRNAALLSGSYFAGQLHLKAQGFFGEKPISIAIIGCGDRGRGIAATIGTMPAKYNIAGLCDVLPFRLKEIQADEWVKNATIYQDYRAVLSNNAITAVIIATPLNTHFAIAKAALLAGKHVFLEKAMTYNIEEAIALVALSKQYPQQVLQVGHQYRYTPLYFKVKEMIQKGYLGKITQVDCRWDRNWNWRRPVPNPTLERAINWRMYKAYSGGLFAELLSHQMDFINWVFDTHPDEITATGGIDYYKDGRETFDNVQATLRYNKEGMIGNFGATCGNARDGYLFKIKGTKGTIELLMSDGAFYPEKEAKKMLTTVDGVTSATKITWKSDGGIALATPGDKDGTWYAIAAFATHIQEKTYPVSNVITGAKAAICVHLANNAAYNHTIEHWQPAYNLL